MCDFARFFLYRQYGKIEQDNKNEKWDERQETVFTTSGMGGMPVICSHGHCLSRGRVRPHEWRPHASGLQLWTVT
jgi:hypothetical protein